MRRGMAMALIIIWFFVLVTSYLFTEVINTIRLFPHKQVMRAYAREQAQKIGKRKEWYVKEIHDHMDRVTLELYFDADSDIFVISIDFPKNHPDVWKILEVPEDLLLIFRYREVPHKNMDTFSSGYLDLVHNNENSRRILHRVA